ncbi:MAG: hypothetical protein Q7T63_01900 [Burkholderiaceae bacterium]|nr:hypothetical protein [Burkholderiaceae bacterium]
MSITSGTTISPTQGIGLGSTLNMMGMPAAAAALEMLEPKLGQSSQYKGALVDARYTGVTTAPPPNSYDLVMPAWLEALGELAELEGKSKSLDMQIAENGFQDKLKFKALAIEERLKAAILKFEAALCKAAGAMMDAAGEATGDPASKAAGKMASAGMSAMAAQLELEAAKHEAKASEYDLLAESGDHVSNNANQRAGESSKKIAELQNQMMQMMAQYLATQKGNP